MNRSGMILACGMAALALSACTSTKYYGPTDHVDYLSDGKMKTSTQTSSLKDGKDSMVSTYDEEKTFDSKGNLLKLKQTEYIDRLASDKKYIVWETSYKAIGDYVVPASISANGVTFLTVDYSLLTTSAKGAITEDISERQFSFIVNKFLSQPQSYDANITLDYWDLGFKADDHFVKRVSHYNFYDGLYYDNILTPGWDNVALKSFTYSSEKLSEGMAKTYTGYDRDSEMFRRMAKGKSVEYTFAWKVIGDSVCETSMTYENKVATDFQTKMSQGFLNDPALKFEAKMDYNAAGKRIKETWFTSDPTQPKVEPALIFEQDLTY